MNDFKRIWNDLKKRPLAFSAAGILLLFFLIGLYAPFFASSKPIVAIFEGHLYFPLFRYLFYKGFYTKEIDLFYNVLMFTFPLFVAALFIKKNRKMWVTAVAGLHVILFTLVSFGVVKDPESDFALNQQKQKVLKSSLEFKGDPLLAPLPPFPSFSLDLAYRNDYSRLNEVLKYRQKKKQEIAFKPYGELYFQKTGKQMPTLFGLEERNQIEYRKQLEKTILEKKQAFEKANLDFPTQTEAYRSLLYEKAVAHNSKSSAELEKKIETAREELSKTRDLIEEERSLYGRLTRAVHKQRWLEEKESELHILLAPLFRPYHWEEDVGGSSGFNPYLPWYEKSRINRKDLTSALIFGIRVSLVVGVTAVTIALAIGLFFGTLSGYFAGKFDITFCRFIEIWEAMPTFFMLLLIVAITQSKSIFLVVLALGAFGWTSFARFTRGEVLRQRTLPYVLTLKSFGFKDFKIMFSHILPNALPPILTLLPFAMMAAITSEAGLSFLGLGEEGSASWGVLMSEGRSVFPGESYLLWPPAILLTILLVSIAIVGDFLRDALDPKMRN